MKIRSLTLKNIGVFEDETISFPEKQDKNLAEIHILTGQNGTGKTTILQALAEVTPRMTSLLNLQIDKEKSFFKKFKNKQNSFINAVNSLGNNIPLMFFGEVNWDGDYSSYYDGKSPLEICAFAYSGNRLIEHEDNMSIKEISNYYPLKNALEFNKTYKENDYTLNQWLANNISKSALAQKKKDNISRFDENIRNLERIINEIIKEDDNERGIQFDINYEENLKVVFIDKQGQELDFDLLPDGLRSIISWLGDLIMRMDALKWKDDLPIFEREFILFLDEIEVHLHPSWQRKILPVVQKLFKNAQIFITTHSPFIVNSVDGAWIHKIELTDKGAKVNPATISENGNSIGYVLRETFGIKEEFGLEVNNDLEKFYQFRDKLLAGNLNGSEYKFIELSKSLAVQSLELNTIIQFELRQINKVLNTNYSL